MGGLRLCKPKNITFLAEPSTGERVFGGRHLEVCPFPRIQVAEGVDKATSVVSRSMLGCQTGLSMFLERRSLPSATRRCRQPVEASAKFPEVNMALLNLAPVKLPPDKSAPVNAASTNTAWLRSMFSRTLLRNLHRSGPDRENSIHRDG